MHRVHDSIMAQEMNSNYGFNLTWWDRLFGTYRTRPAAGQLGMTIGLEVFRDPRELRLDKLLWQPFRNPERTAVTSQPVRWTTTRELHDQLINQRTTTLIDVRGSDEFAGPIGYVAGARNIPLDELSQRLPELGRTMLGPIVVICFTDKRSTTAAALIDAAGFTDVSVLRGGMKAWLHDGLPAVHEQASATTVLSN